MPGAYDFSAICTRCMGDSPFHPGIPVGFNKLRARNTALQFDGNTSTYLWRGVELACVISVYRRHQNFMNFVFSNF